ncbi:MAG: hypothetical protein LBV67_04845 [Streptococcaceae bacterium]|jgi:hypothetical protein|nr:hypothetical protein [Streptococcaceae bacterium]
MKHLPKDFDDLNTQVEDWKEKYLGKNPQAITEEQMDDKENDSRTRLQRFWKIASPRQKMKHEFVRLESKKTRLLLEGKTKEATLIKKKIKMKKQIYKDSYYK